MEMHYFNSFDEAETHFRRRFTAIRTIPVPQLRGNELTFEAPPIPFLRRDKLLLTRVGNQRRAYMGYTCKPGVVRACLLLLVVLVSVLGWNLSFLLARHVPVRRADFISGSDRQTFDL